MSFGHQKINLVDNSKGEEFSWITLHDCHGTAQYHPVLNLYTIHNLEFISAADRKPETVSSGWVAFTRLSRREHFPPRLSGCCSAGHCKHSDAEGKIPLILDGLLVKIF